ncbi:hypothetical protein FLA_1556 [Filimonas lacunae]|nr:hypothetical protein FLA_1556 [Filimonas lacunae]
MRIYTAGSFRFWMGVLVVMLSLASCKKDSYRTDGGLASANTSLSTYDYLAANAYHYFDTLLLIVDHFGLKDSVNKAGSFFAPTDYAIQRVMSANNIVTLEDLYAKINSKFLTQYMFADASLTLDNATTTVQTHENWAGTEVGISKLASSYYVATTTFTYYTLQYVKINGVLDGSPDAPANDETDAILKCQTTGIKTATGTNLNVLVNNAALNLIGDKLPTELDLLYNVNVTQSSTDYTLSPVQLESDKIAGFFGVDAATIGDMINAGNADWKYYALEPNGNLNSGYTANAPGFWFDKNGYVANWGDDAYLFAEFTPGTFIVNVGQYPDHAKVGDTYTLKQVIAYTKSNGTVLSVIITIHVTLV